MATNYVDLYQFNLGHLVIGNTEATVPLRFPSPAVSHQNCLPHQMSGCVCLYYCPAQSDIPLPGRVDAGPPSSCGSYDRPAVNCSYHLRRAYTGCCITELHHSVNQSIKCIYKTLFTSADVTKYYTKTQPKPPHSKQCRCFCIYYGHGLQQN